MIIVTQLSRFRVSSLVLLLSVVSASSAIGQPTVGLISYDPDSTYDGYTLVSPFASDTTYLIDMWGRVVHSWDTDASPLNQAYLLSGGTLLKAQNGPGSNKIEAPGSAGTVRKYTWDGALQWDFSYKSDTARAHHDIEPLPNGNVLIIAWEFKTAAEFTAQGGNASLLDTVFIWPEHIVEVKKTGPTTGDIVWKWHMWDHVIQDFDNTKPNFGVVGDNPQLIDLNQVGSGDPDWAHMNGIDYNPSLDQIALSTPNFNEIWIIDHSTTTAEAAGHSGGNSGKGGDLLYRWGNPQKYDQGTGSDQKLFFQHDARWISPGLPGAGNMLVFNNRNPGGAPGPPGDFSTVNEIVTPDSGFLYKNPAPTFLPTDFVWSYEAVPPTDFIGRALSGAQRLLNGNTLVCNGAQGTVFEVTPSGTEVWRWVSPVITGGTIVTQGTVVASFTNLVFKCDRYPGDSGALAGRELPPGWTIESGTAQTAALVSPADSTVNVGTLPTFQWSAAINATSYAIQVSSDESFGSLVVDQAGIIGTSYSVTSKTAVPLPEGVYFWKVQSSNGFGVGGPSQTRIFSTNETLLPVELVAFRARTTGEGEVVLTWETATETNNAGFDVEHRFLTDDFEPIAFVVGLGTTLDPQSYRITATDLEPGLHTFRLKQIDLDGRFAYHGPVQIELEAPTALWLATPYPNPFNPRATVRFSVSAPGAVELNVYDVVGHLVQTLYRGDPGADRFVEATFDGTGLSSGVYVIRLESEFGLSVSKTALLSK